MMDYGADPIIDVWIIFIFIILIVSTPMIVDIAAAVRKMHM